MLSDNYAKATRHPGIERVEDVSICRLKELAESADIIVSGDSRVSRTGKHWVGFGTQYLGVEGAVRWAKKVRNALSLPAADGWRD